jgi:hypothetical protein
MRITLSILLILGSHLLTAQQDTISDLLFDLKKANPNNYYKYELDSTSYCLIKYNTKLEIDDVVFINQNELSKIDTVRHKKHNIKYSVINEKKEKNGGELFIFKKNNAFWITGTSNNQENGKTYFYSGKNKKLVSVYNMLNGEKYGLDREFDDEGNVTIEYFYNKTLPLGFKWRKIYYEGTNNLAEIATSYEKYAVNEVYHLNGNLNFIDTVDFIGNRIGHFKKYHDNGNIQEESFFKDGLRHGYTKYYYKSGQLHLEGNFNLGKKSGVIKYYYENGKLKSEEEFLIGIRHGVSKYYNSNGDLILIEKYKEGKRISKEKIK